MEGNKKTFRVLQEEGPKWITVISSEYYPDTLEAAKEYYRPALEKFRSLIDKVSTSEELYKEINKEKGWMHIQLHRIFRKYVSPGTSVEMLKVKSKEKMVLRDFSYQFRSLDIVKEVFSRRPFPDEALAAVLWEYKDRGQSGYRLTEEFFAKFRERFPDLVIMGPESAGSDILLHTVLPDYPNQRRPVDFIIMDNGEAIAVGLARYDSDRGGAQEDDRIGGYKNCADEVLRYSESNGKNIKVIFVNDGPGLLLGSMWKDYAYIEESWVDKILVITLKMMEERLTREWLRG